MTSLADALSGHLVGWTGLEGDLDPAVLERSVGVRWTPEPGPRTRVASAFTVLHGERDGAPAQIDAWVRQGDTEVTTLEYRPPALFDHTAVLEDLGEPETTLRSHHFEAGSSVREHVHAGRGITVAVAEPFGDDDAAPYILYVQLYRPMSTQEFVTTVGQSGDELRPYPRPPG
jgi:hypothetical protein